ncbi:MAG: hypothetical protein HYY16_15010 [Planctomycetes bacterium]|nr:hypothetical protein [Planctomycetota bacterium]
MNRHTARGTTLIEIAVATGILAIMMAFVSMIFFNAQRSGEDISISAGLTSRGRIALDTIRSELAFASMSFTPPPATGGVDVDHSRIRYQIPIVVAGTPTYGCVTSTASIDGGFHEIVFVADLILRETNGAAVALQAENEDATQPAGTLIAQMDVNNDGDQNDTFARGRLRKRSYDNGGGLQEDIALDDYVLLRCKPGSLDELDGAIRSDGMTPAIDLDPLFLLIDDTGAESPSVAATRRVRVTLWHADFDKRGRAVLMIRSQDDVRLENPQS